MAVPVLAGLVGVVTAVGGLISSVTNALSQHPILAYFLVLSFFILDGGISYGFNVQGAFGSIFTFVLNNLGVYITVYSWQLLILVGISPIVLFVVRASSS